MAKHHRKSHRKSHRKAGRTARRTPRAHRKSHRKSHRRSHKGSRSAHQRGGECSAMPRNFASFQQQRGGMAPIATGDSYLLDAASRVQAEVGPLDKALADLPAVIPKQMGGRRKQKQSRKQKQHRRSHKGSRSAYQRGGMSAFDAPSMLLDKAAYAADGTNAQFRTEGTVNSLYGEFKGAQ